MSRLLGQVERQIARLLEGTLSSEGLTVDQWRTLDLLADGEGHPMSELAGSLVVPGPTLTKIMDKLVDATLVYRLVDDRDRRRVLAFLSEEGRSLHTAIEPRVAAVEAEAVAGLGADALVLTDLLARLAEQNAPAGARG
ncbi:MarR family winged helix-turn-helix transcriptional regulator [Pseudonocardia sp. NPDC046786]|uniref:MarR family winged helix-turn-helix transcriptional regulator n=1 Tax=Pseudonocardia sp. NPDC046786 TaxID=3155471 RepID=UPI0033CED730